MKNYSNFFSEMVGENQGILNNRRGETGKHDQDGISCTYSRRKNEKKAKFENDVDTADIEINEKFEHQHLVDKFVQVSF